MMLVLLLVQCCCCPTCAAFISMAQLENSADPAMMQRSGTWLMSTVSSPAVLSGAGSAPRWGLTAGLLPTVPLLLLLLLPAGALLLVALLLPAILPLLAALLLLPTGTVLLLLLSELLLLLPGAADPAAAGGCLGPTLPHLCGPLLLLAFVLLQPAKAVTAGLLLALLLALFALLLLLLLVLLLWLRPAAEMGADGLLPTTAGPGPAPTAPTLPGPAAVAAAMLFRVTVTPVVPSAAAPAFELSGKSAMTASKPGECAPLSGVRSGDVSGAAAGMRPASDELSSSRCAVAMPAAAFVPSAAAAAGKPGSGSAGELPCCSAAFQDSISGNAGRC
jgi:hypothetical protein